jgi:polyhydroxybutyrate depolymerase
MKLLCTLGIVTLCGWSCRGPASSKPHVDPGRYVKSIRVGNLDRNYVLRVPKSYDNKTRLPLVVLYHGWTSSAAEIERQTKFGAKADKEGFILVVPNGTEGVANYKGWNTGFLNLGSPDADDVKLTSDILDEVEKDLYVDEDRVFVAGHSNGAMFAYKVGAELSDRIAAIAVVSGTVGMAEGHIPEPKSPVSAIIFHGKADETVPYDEHSRGLIQSISAPESAKWWADKDGCGTPTESKSGAAIIDDYKGGRAQSEVELVSIIKGGHSWPVTTEVPATDMIWTFFQSHPKHRS